MACTKASSLLNATRKASLQCIYKAPKSLRQQQVSFIHTTQRLRQQQVYGENFEEPIEGGHRKERIPVNMGIMIVPQQKAYIVERFGRFSKMLEPGLNFLIPVIDNVAYVHSLKEDTIVLTRQHAITRDNVTIEIDGVLYVRIVDPYKASYGVADPLYAVTQLAQTTMRSELGKMTLDKTFEERENLNSSIVLSLNDATEAWGVVCLRYEIRDIKPPTTVRQAMEMQAEAERKKRAHILESEAEQQSSINLAMGHQRAEILKAEGEARAISVKAQATADAIKTIAKSIDQPMGNNAVALRVAESYLDAFSQIAKESTTMLLPANASDPASMIGQAMTIYNRVTNQTPGALADSYKDGELFIPAGDSKN